MSRTLEELLFGIIISLLYEILSFIVSKINDKNSLKKSLLILEELIPMKYNSIYFWKLIGMNTEKLGDNAASLVAIAEEKILKKQYDKAKIFASKALKYKNIKTLYKIRASDIINFK